MEAAETVSIIVPVYNAERFLNECVTSILKQTYRQIELILVNDGSADGSGELCDRYAQQDSRVKVIHQKNAGPSAARNRGVQAAAGAYLQFVDADDCVEPHMTETLMRALPGDGQLVICGYRTVLKEDGKIIRTRPFGFSRPGVYDKKAFLQVFGELYTDYFTHYNWNKLYVTALIREAGLAFDTEVLRGEDLLFNLQYYELCRKIQILSDPLYHYTTTNASSITSTFRPDLFENQQLLLGKTRDFLQRHQAYSGTNKELVERFYTVRIGACFSNLFHPESQLPSPLIRRHIREIISDEQVRQSVPYFMKGNLEKKLTGALIRRKSVRLLYGYYAVKSFLKKRMNGTKDKWV